MAFLKPASLRTCHPRVSKSTEPRHLRLTPHLARHGGISTDVFEQDLDLPTAKKRGQWSSDTSVRRYEKHGRLIAVLNKLKTDQREAATTAAASIGAKILKHKVLGK